VHLTGAEAAELRRRATEGAWNAALARELRISRETVHQHLWHVTEIEQNAAT
jgi:DNA-binding CsgD family transcriptional regulator